MYGYMIYCNRCVNNNAMKITVEQLREHEACQEGIDAFLDVFGQEANIEWTVEKQIELYTTTELKKYLYWAYEEKILPLFSMRGADLRGADLCEADLREVKFCDDNGNEYIV
jgi:uncharacterized protein YjbI with pentapeptide repeats